MPPNHVYVYSLCSAQIIRYIIKFPQIHLNTKYKCTTPQVYLGLLNRTLQLTSTTNASIKILRELPFLFLYTKYPLSMNLPTPV